jgi:hypothetical protein
MGVIQKIVMSVFDETGSISDGIIDATDPMATVNVTPGNFGVLILNNTASLLQPGEGVTESSSGVFDRTSEPVSWFKLLDQYPGKFRAGLSTIRLAKSDDSEIVATASVNPTDDTQMVLNFDSDTVPGNTVLSDSTTSRGTIDAIIDPTKFNPETATLATGTRYLLLSDPNPNTFAWQDEAVGAANDIITWNGSNWEITFDASANEERADSSVSQDPVYITNTYTGVQYKFTNEQGAWLKSYEGEYLKGSWRLVL